MGMQNDLAPRNEQRKQPKSRVECGFGEHGVKHRVSVCFFALTDFREESSVSSSQPTSCVQKQTHAELTEPA